MNFKGSHWLWLGVIAAAVLIGVAWLHSAYPGSLSDRDSQIGIVHSVLLLALVGSSLLVRGRVNMGKMARDALLWVAIGGLVLIGYSFRHEAAWLGQRLAGDLSPSSGVATQDSISFPVSAGGHFVVEALVDGEPLRFLVDTGATDVVLSPADAERLGFDPAQMDFTKMYQTANGTVLGAPVRLGVIEVGPIRVENVRASVNGAAMNRSLLGMSFLERLGGYEVADDRLTLRPR